MDAGKRALDDLFSNASKYRTTQSYRELMAFIAKFRKYAPFNAMLVHVQKPGARFVLPAHQWRKNYKRTIRPDAQPLVILQPMGPVMFVFDVSETEGAPLPAEVEAPFSIRSGKISSQLSSTIENARRDGVRVAQPAHGSQMAGSIRRAQFDGGAVEFRETQVPLRYELLMNANHDESSRYSTLVHELAHLYCGHLGTPNPKWWPDRGNLSHDVEEFEAESVCYLVCKRIGLETKSDEYLASYCDKNRNVPHISLDRVLSVARQIEEMGRRKLSVRRR
ncbi:ImmA/IrrE family metallo-endopeptidase [Lacipirellula parvula]|uniref:IrrE N-terminal-like domain-containing protein n=1 Tax=Lacipirellula parvula TaxID=2650471 RepID=A0A5K7XNN6_9BACT|nr:ImmA/IrrE family metallo-endopeptidase [Lacipirellula parvula]BBO34799.1 hypothetical protein PLANPX_4411 [Lacipirellula parvula]